MPQHQSQPLQFSHNDKNNGRFDSPSEPYPPRCRTENPDPDPDQAHPDLSKAEQHRNL